MLFFLGADAALGLLAALLVLRSARPRRAARLLAAVTGLIAALCALIAANILGAPAPRWLYLFAGGSGFLVPPALLLIYVREMTGRFKAADWLWLAPGLVHFSLLMAFDVSAHAPNVAFLSGFTVVEGGGAAAQILAPAPALIFIIILILSLVDLRRHEEALKRRFAAIERYDLAWARNVMRGALAASGLGAVLAAGSAFAPAWLAEALITGVIVLLGVFIAAIAAFAPDQERAEALEPTAPAHAEPPDGLNGEMIRAALLNEDLLTKEDLRLGDLARALDVSARTLSAALAHDRAGNFHEFVNRERVARACGHLADPAFDDVSILSIALDAGFQSKATFNRVFKAQTGVTPSAYRARSRADARR